PIWYFEFDAVKSLARDSKWLFEHRGRAIKIVAPLLAALPQGLACRGIMSDRDLEEILDSQERMLARRGTAHPERRRMLKGEYVRTLARVEAMLVRRAATQLLVVKHSAVI